MKGLHYTFSVEHAEKYGLNEAIILHNFIYWLNINRANNHNYIDGRYWTYNSAKAFQNLFPFWTQKQIQYLLSKMVDCGILLQGCFNKDKRDRTSWYTLSDDFFSDCILQNREMDDTKSGNDILQNREMIYITDKKQQIKNTNENNINTASGFSQNENPISRKNGKIEIKTSEYGKTQILCPCGEELLDETLEPDKYFCSECLSMYSKDEVLKIAGVNENPVVNDSFTTQNPTVKESLTVQKQKKEIEITKKDDIESFVRNFKASEFEVDGVIQFQSIFSESEIHLITKWILRRKETHKSKVKNTEQAITGVLNDILDIKNEIPLETIFEQRDGCYVYCGASGDASKTHQSIKLEYFTKLIKKPTFNNQYAKAKPDYLEVQKRYATTGELQLSTTYRKRRD